jgi:hypothetical protein
MSRNRKKKAKSKGALKKSAKGSKKKKYPQKAIKKVVEKLTPKQREAPAKVSTEKDEGKDTKKPVDMVQAREKVSDLVRKSAAAIATGVINSAKRGQLASAKYLFEAVGLYPATGQTPEGPAEYSLAHTLLRRMGLPLEPVVVDDDDAPVAAAASAIGMGGGEGR